MLKRELLKRFGFELEMGDQIEFAHNYCDDNIVDVTVIDHRTGEKHVFEAYDLKRHMFPY